MSRRRASYRAYTPLTSDALARAYYGTRRRRPRAARQERQAVRDVPTWVAPVWMGMLTGSAVVLLLVFGGS